MAFTGAYKTALRNCSFADIQRDQNNRTNATATYHGPVYAPLKTTYKVEGNLVTDGSRSAGLPPPALSPITPCTTASLQSLFPTIDPAVLNAITNHTLQPWDLRNLDPRCVVSGQTSHLPLLFAGTKVFLRPINTSEHYTSLDTIFVPLQNYFRVLVAHSQSTSVASSFFHYNAHLSALADRYPWPAVRAYHMAFFKRRCFEMSMRGDYTGWGRGDAELFEEHLLEHCARAIQEHQQEISSPDMRRNSSAKFSDRCELDAHLVGNGARHW